MTVTGGLACPLVLGGMHNLVTVLVGNGGLLWDLFGDCLFADLPALLEGLG